MTRRALAVAAATLLAPMMAAAALAAIGAAAGGNHAEMGSLAGTQGLRGTTVGVTSPAPAQGSSPAGETLNGSGKEDASEVGKSQTAPATDPQRNPSPEQGARAPSHKPPARTKPPTHTAPKAPSNRVGTSPSVPTSNPSYPGSPGAPTTTGGTGSGTGSGTGTSGSGSYSGGGQSSPDSPDGYSGGD